MKKFPPLIILVGSMGAGKTSTAKELAKSLNLPFLDTDQWIEEMNGKSISEIFKEKGEAYFREQEKAAVNWLAQQGPMVVSTGGGLWMNDDLRERLLSMGWCVWLKVSVEEAWKRIGYHLGQRPMLDKEKDPKAALTYLLLKREPVYGMAHNVFFTDHKSAKDVAASIVKIIQDENILEFP